MMKLRPAHALLSVLLLAAAAVPALAGGFPSSSAGTYLIEEAGGARDFWYPRPSKTPSPGGG